MLVIGLEGWRKTGEYGMWGERRRVEGDKFREKLTDWGW